MAERDYYPAGALNDPNAPYNQVEAPEYDFDIEYCITLTATAKITSNVWDWWNDEPTYAGDFSNDLELTYKGLPHFIQELLNKKQDELAQLQEQARVHKTRRLRMDVESLKEEIAELKMYQQAEIEITEL